jgi:lactate permease
MVGRQLPFFSVIIPFWLVAAYAGLRRTAAVWPALAVAGIFFAVPQWAISNYHGPWLVDVGAAAISLGAVTFLLRFWHPRDSPPPLETSLTDRRDEIKAWTPWIILSVVVFAWGLPAVKSALDGISKPTFTLAALHNLVLRVPPVVAQPKPESAVYVFNWLSATGTGILVAALIAAAVMGFSPRRMARVYWNTLVTVRKSLLTIAAMLAIGYVVRYSGVDAILGLAFARTGMWYPFFGTLLGWLGVALTGSDTASNVLFGGLQQITAQQVGVSPTLMAAANSSGGVMGKMIDMQSIVVATTTTHWFGHEWAILRFVFLHSVALASLVAALVALEAYVVPFTALVVH